MEEVSEEEKSQWTPWLAGMNIQLPFDTIMIDGVLCVRKEDVEDRWRCEHVGR